MAIRTSWYVDWDKLPGILESKNWFTQTIDFQDPSGNTHFKNVKNYSVLNHIISEALRLKDRPKKGRHYVIGSYSLTDGPLLPSSSGSIIDRVKYCNKDFRKRASAGEIIVSPYSICRWNAIMKPGVRVDDLSQVSTIELCGGQGSDYDKFAYSPVGWKRMWSGELGDIGDLPSRVHNGYSVNQTAGTINPLMLFTQYGCSIHPYPTQSLSLPEMRLTTTDVDHSVLGVSAQSILDHLRRVVPRDIDSLTVMKALAKANDGDLDVLTALAELPELLKSAVGGYRAIANILVGVKKREFQIHKNSKRILNARIKELQHLLTNRKITSRYFKQKIKRLRHEARKEVAEAIASVYLQARYNIGPTVGMLADIGDIVLNWGREFERYREKKIETLNMVELASIVPDWSVSFEGSAEVIHRCFIKRLYDLSSPLKQLGKVLMADIFVTAFELSTYYVSIIGNWFVSFEEALKSISYRTIAKQEGAQYSTKVEIQGSLFYSRIIGFKPVTVEVQIQADDYVRTVINPSSHIGLYWRPEMNLLRYLDATAFTFNKAKTLWQVDRPNYPTRSLR